MEVKTINPVLVNPQDPNVNGYVGSNVVNIDLRESLKMSMLGILL